MGDRLLRRERQAGKTKRVAGCCRSPSSGLVALQGKGAPQFQKRCRSVGNSEALRSQRAES